MVKVGKAKRLFICPQTNVRENPEKMLTWPPYPVKKTRRKSLVITGDYEETTKTRRDHTYQ